MKLVALTAIVALCLTTVSMGQCAITNANNPGASLTLNGTNGFAGCSGELVIMNFTSDQVGSPFDICFGPLAAACTPLIDDAIELDLATSYSLFGGACGQGTLPPVGLGFGAASMDFTFVSEAGIGNLNNLQAGAVDATDPDGVSLSEVSTYAVAPAVYPWTSVGDDATLDLTGDACWAADVNFYGTMYDGAHLNSNGEVTFGAGTSDFTATYGEWASGMPRIGWAADLQPNVYGSVTTNFLADGIRVDYTDVAEWGTGGLGVISFSVEVSASAGASITGMTEDGTWGGTGQCLGASNGSLGTDPTAGAGVSFDAILAAGGGMGLASDMWVEAAGGMVSGAGSSYTNILFPAADGSSISVN